MAEKGIFVDFDGTLVDSVGALQKAYCSFLACFGVTGSEAEFQSLNGPPLSRIVEVLRIRYKLTDAPGELAARYSDLINAAHASARPTQGASELLARARMRGWKVAVVTSSSSRSARAWLDRNEMSAHVNVVVGGEDVSRGKPDPEPYRLALQQTECSAAHSFAIEDSPLGAQSAVGAGLLTYGIRLSDRDGWPNGVKFIQHLNEMMDFV